MKIYTRTGDDGTTGLLGGSRVRKSDARIDCYGTVDELNAAVGLAAVAAPSHLAAMLREIQNDLFLLGSHLAAPAGGAPQSVSLPALDPAIVARLEAQIDVAEKELPPLRQFILPGGSEAAARLHLARTVCRRAERRAVEVSGNQPVPRVILHYLNRLSDWLFVQARSCNRIAGIQDVPWSA